MKKTVFSQKYPLINQLEQSCAKETYIMKKTVFSQKYPFYLHQLLIYTLLLKLCTTYSQKFDFYC